ncbi:MAG: beta-N-acetylhexosaminidase [Paracoccaceae bacterium]
MVNQAQNGQGAYILGCEGPRLSAPEAAFFARAQPWGFILFARNVETPDQLRRLTADLRDAVGRDAPILVDQEGGRVQRLTAPHWRQWLPPLDQVEMAGENAARSMWLRYRLIAAELREVGIDVNCAPSGDIAEAETHKFLKNRCYGSDAQTVSLTARSVSDGLLAGGVLPIIKHIPGHGRAKLDSHLNPPRVTASADDLSAKDFAPFVALNDLPMAMTAHIIYQAFDDVPATISEKLVQLIRDQIGFDGLLITDDVSMQALDGTVVERSLASMHAGCDLVLHCNGDLAEMKAVADALGPMRPAGQLRADKALTYRETPQSLDINAVEAELQALLKDRAFV